MADMFAKCHHMGDTVGLEAMFVVQMHAMLLGQNPRRARLAGAGWPRVVVASGVLRLLLLLQQHH